MAIKHSTGLRNHMMDTGSAKSALDGGYINIYGGASAPATADDAVPGGAVLLCTLSVNSTGTGINFDSSAVGAVLSKDPSEVWSGVNLDTGTAMWYRHVGDSDDGTLSTSQPRIQGSVGTLGADMEISNVNLTSGATQTINSYSIALPTL